MPTPVSLARQFLAEESAAVLDDAVTVAKRRSHAQATSLHAVSALLSPPSSTLRDACTRSARSACSPRLQLRALELCVGVALDKVSASKSAVDDPQVSNSLMAAIKRSQANQKRHPETFQLYQQQQLQSSSPCSSISAVKVDLKHFVTSILDDPVVNRVFSDAGFRSNEIKWAILNPISRFSTPPLFSCDSRLNNLGRNFPFPVAAENVDDNSRRVWEILVRTNRRNPLLIGVYARDAVRNLVEGLKRGENGVLPKEIDGLSVVSIENEISEFVKGGLSEDMMGLKLKQVGDMVENSEGSGILVNCEDLKAFVDVKSVDIVNYMVSEMKRLLRSSGGKLWLIGAVAGDYEYKKLLERFPLIEMDWDLHLLPITNSSSGGKSFKSSLMGSFVPLGGFFSMPSKHETLHTTVTQSSTLCTLCNEKYDKEVSVVLKRESTNSAADKHSISLSPWLQVSQSQTSNIISDTMEAKNVKTILDAKVMGIQRKWSDICHQLHFSWTSQEDISPAKLQTSASVCTSSPSVISVTTDLGLGTLYTSTKEPSKKPDLQEHYNVTRNSSESSRTREYTKDLEYPWKVVAEKVYWQSEAIHTISQTLSCCSNKGNIWLSFLGPDKMGKRKIAAAVAEIVSGKKEQLISFDLSSQDVVSPSNSVFDYYYDPKMHSIKSGRKMIVDYLAEELSKRSQSVVLLENIEKADFLVQNSLSQAVKTGKFQDSRGGDISICNKVFILMSSVVKGREAESEFSEEKILEAKDFEMQLVVGSVDGNHSRNTRTNVLVTPSTIISNQFPVNKRKSINNDPSKTEMLKRSRSVIDLNLPVVEDMEDENDIDKCDDNDDDNESSENSKVWLEKLLEQVDENVGFKPFDFDFLGRRILKEIDGRLKKVVGDGIFLEIDREVMVQILAAAWLTDRMNAYEDWIEKVLCSSIKEAQQKWDISSDFVMKLVACNGFVVRERASGVCLPARINLN